MPKIVFSDREKNDIISKFKDGKTCKQIAEEYFVNQATIRARLKEWNAYENRGARSFNDEDIAKIAFEMYRGRKAKMIAAEYGISVDTVRNYRRMLDESTIPVHFLKPGDVFTFEQTGQKFAVIEIMLEGKVVRSYVADGRDSKLCFVYGDLWINNEPHRIRYTIEELYEKLTWGKIVGLQS